MHTSRRWFPWLNCDQPIRSNEQARLYCSDLCGEEAKTVRYVRGCNRDGRAEQPEVREAIQIRLAMVIGGGYPERERSLPRSVREEVFARDGRRCRRCGQPGRDIDHIKGSSNEIMNLQLLCGPCHNKKTLEGLVPVSPEHRQKRNELLSRINARKPKRPCDDEVNWKTLYLEILSERR